MTFSTSWLALYRMGSEWGILLERNNCFVKVLHRLTPFKGILNLIVIIVLKRQFGSLSLIIISSHITLCKISFVKYTFLKLINILYIYITQFELILTHSPDKMHLLILNWFYSTKWFKMMGSNLSKLKKLRPHKNYNCKWKLSEVPFWMYNRMCWFDINTYNGQSCSGIEYSLPSLAESLKQSELTIRIQTHSRSQNNGKYALRRASVAEWLAP